MDYAALATATKAQFADWDAIAYQPILDWWNETTGIRWHPSGYWVNVRTLLNVLGLTRGTEVWLTLKAAAESNPVLGIVVPIMERPESSGIDIANDQAFGMMQALQASSILTEAEVTTFSDLAHVPATRGELAGFEHVTEADLARALRGV